MAKSPSFGVRRDTSLRQVHAWHWIGEREALRSRKSRRLNIASRDGVPDKTILYSPTATEEDGVLHEGKGEDSVSEATVCVRYRQTNVEFEVILCKNFFCSYKVWSHIVKNKLGGAMPEELSWL